tara:strand:+ start:514 stop:687 length:174 start_codon:yes stop_codon:yes gene_type:complete
MSMKRYKVSIMAEIYKSFLVYAEDEDSADFEGQQMFDASWREADDVHSVEVNSVEDV